MTTGRINQVRLANRAAATEVNLSRHANTGSEQNVENHILELRNQTIARLTSLSVVSDDYISTNTQYLEKFA